MPSVLAYERISSLLSHLRASWAIPGPMGATGTGKMCACVRLCIPLAARESTPCLTTHVLCSVSLPAHACLVPPHYRARARASTQAQGRYDRGVAMESKEGDSTFVKATVQSYVDLLDANKNKVS